MSNVRYGRWLSTEFVHSKEIQLYSTRIYTNLGQIHDTRKSTEFSYLVD